MNCANFVNPVVEKKQSWNVGDWVYDIEKEIVEIIRLGGDTDIIARPLGKAYTFSSYKSNLRPLTPADWTREVDGVKYRAYKDSKGYVYLYERHEDKTNSAYDYSFINHHRKFCEAYNIPIMPYKLSKGKYECPE